MNNHPDANDSATSLLLDTVLSLESPKDIHLAVYPAGLALHILAMLYSIEMALCGLAHRLTGSTGLILFTLLCLIPYPDTALAQPTVPTAYSNKSDELTVDGPRLLKQPLNSEQAQQSITQLLNKPPLKIAHTTKNGYFNGANDAAHSNSYSAMAYFLREQGIATNLLANLTDLTAPASMEQTSGKQSLYLTLTNSAREHGANPNPFERLSSTQRAAANTTIKLGSATGWSFNSLSTGGAE